MYLSKENKTFSDLELDEYLNNGYIIFMWIWVVLMFVMNILSLGMYAMIMYQLKTQLKRIYPNTENADKPRHMYKGVVKLFFIMIYFTITWGLTDSFYF
jgi:hypothetical protein